MKLNFKKIFVFSLFFPIFVLLFLFVTTSNTFSLNRPVSGDTEEKSFGELNLEKNNKTVLLAVGDIMLARTVEEKMISKDDWTYPFLKTKDLISSADIAFGNLETTIIEGETSAYDSFFFRTDPKAVEGLKSAGFDVLSLANNHMMNFGTDGIDRTLEVLDEAEISHMGAGKGNEIYKPVIKEVNGIKFGFLAYTYADEKIKSSEGVYGTNYMDVDLMQSQVESLSKEVDVVVVSMHSGVEYKTEPNYFQKNFARNAIDAGADLVLGHHPHVVQTVEEYEDGYIIYSLGNFVFDQMWSEETRLGAVAEIVFIEDEISEIKFIPVKIFDYSQPQFIEGTEAEKILERLSF